MGTMHNDYGRAIDWFDPIDSGRPSALSYRNGRNRLQLISVVKFGK